jgi:hypothetical protein
MGREPLPDLPGCHSVLPQERNGFGVQRFRHLPNFCLWFGKLRPVLSEDTHAVVSGGRHGRQVASSCTKRHRLPRDRQRFCQGEDHRLFHTRNPRRYGLTPSFLCTLISL